MADKENIDRKVLRPLEMGQRSGIDARASFSLTNRIFRAIWVISWQLFARWTPPAWHPWRRWLLVLFGAEVEPGARIYSSVSIWYPPNLIVRRGAIIGWRVVCYNQGLIEIGARAIISQYSHLVSGTHLVDDPHFQLVVRPIHIGSHAWIATGAYVGPGVTVGEGAVLGARGVTAKDLAPWTIYAGNPARALRERRWPNDFRNRKSSDL